MNSAHALPFVRVQEKQPEPPNHVRSFLNGAAAVLMFLILLVLLMDVPWLAEILSKWRGFPEAKSHGGDPNFDPLPRLRREEMHA